MNPEPSFGAARRADFLLHPGIDHLNHGSFGATPKPVLAAQTAWRERMEQNPSGFFFEVLPGGIRGAAARLARTFGGEAGDWAFVENATAGVNAVLTSLTWREGDEVIVTGQVYNAVHQALRHHAGRHGVRIVTLEIPVPFEDADLLVASAGMLRTARTRLAVLDHVTSTGATILPVDALVATFKAAGIPVLIDGAHAFGMLPLDVPSIGADWYTGNLHKWCYAAKGCAALWASPARHRVMHPAVISHDYGRGFPAEFDYTGTRDASAWLAAEAALDYMEAAGIEAVRAHGRHLAAEMAAELAGAWGTEISASPEWRGAMASIRLPKPGMADRSGARALTLDLLHRHRIMAPVMPLDGRYWLRISAAMYNQPADYRRLIDIGRGL